MKDLASELIGVEKKAAEELGYLLHPAGGITESFVYEPIGKNQYIYCTKQGQKSIANVEVEYEDPKARRGASWHVDIEGKPHYLIHKPPKKWLFAFPIRKAVEEWVKGEKQARQLTDIWNLNQVYFNTFLDFPHPYEFSIATLFAIQSWLTELIPVVFYLGVKGEFGGGKSVTCETIYPICRHGYETGNLSPPFVARTIDSQKLTLFVDELDSVAGKKDSDLYSIFRQGYRKGGTYSRINPDTLEPESFKIFGAKLFTIHTEIEQALQTRTVPLHVRETADSQYPIVNTEKTAFARKLHTEYFLWYLDNALSLRGNQFEKLDALNILTDNEFDRFAVFDQFNRGVIPTENVEKLSSDMRKTMYEKKVAPLQKGQINQISQMAGRNVELGYLCFVLSNIVGVEIDRAIMDTFVQKLIEEGERTEIGYLGTLKDLLTKTYEEKKQDKRYVAESGLVMISNKELYRCYLAFLEKEGFQGVSPHKFKEYLIEFGFTDGLNRKKMKVPLPDEEGGRVRLCNLFTERVLRKLSIEEPTKPSLGEGLKEIKQWIFENREADGLVDSIKLAEKVKERGLEVQRIVQVLKDEGFIFEAPKVGKWGVSK